MTFNWAVVDVAISLIAVYVAFSLLASWINEQIAAFFQLRSKTLERGIKQMIADEAFHAKLFGHPAIAASTTAQGRGPSYLSAQQFTAALIGTITEGNVVVTGASTDMAALQQQLLRVLPDVSVAGGPAQAPLLRTQLNALLNEAAGDYQKFLSAVGAWFDDTMSRISGWYKRSAGISLIIIGLALSAAFNVDTIQLAKVFYESPISVSDSSLSEVSKGVFSQVPLGWPSPCTPSDTANTGGAAGQVAPPDEQPCSAPTATDVWYKIVGLILTAIALSFGASFWFDVLRQVMNVRNAGARTRHLQRELTKPASSLLFEIGVEVAP